MEIESLQKENQLLRDEVERLKGLFLLMKLNLRQ